MRHFLVVIRLTVTLAVLVVPGIVHGAAPSWADLVGSSPTLALVEATSRTLLKTGQIDFALAIDVDLESADVTRLDMNSAFEDDRDAPRHVLAFSVATAKATRRVKDLKPVRSTLFLGYENQRMSIDPDDPAAQFGFSSRLSPSDKILSTFYDAPQAFGPPLLFTYTYDKAKIEAQRTLTVHAYLIDRVAKTYIPVTFDASERRNFDVAYRLSRYDPNRKRLEQNHDTEQDVDDFERAPFPIALSQLLQAFANATRTPKHFDTATDLRELLLTEGNETLAKLNANTFDSRPLNDPRFDSVVAIYTGRASMGSGFFVTPDVVMTNWHVVQGQRFVEMKLYDGLETFGTVLSKDARLDIALVKVQNRGRPVAFYTGKRLDIGQDVEAIGHPQRLEFSITRGVISAVRRHFSINLPKYAGDEVLYIQTDAPINNGNSGGPLFLGQKVIGMNTWGAAKNIAEGLNFSVHYAELMAFLNENLPGYTVSPAGD